MSRSIELQSRLPLLPLDAIVLSQDLAMQRSDGKVVLFNAAGPIYLCDEDDDVGVRLAMAVVAGLDLAPITALAAAFGVRRATIHRSEAQLREGGVLSLEPKKRGPKGPHKLKDEVLRRAQCALDEGKTRSEVSALAGVSRFAIYHAIRLGLLSTPSTKAGDASSAAPVNESLTRPATRAAEDQACEAGVAVKRTEERALARWGKLPEAAPEFRATEAVPDAGVLLALPALLREGLLDVGTEVYGALSNGFFGLRSVLLTFAFMALLRIKTPEQLTERAPGELGLLLGLDRAPEVKTLRRKLREMGERLRARLFARRLTEIWSKSGSRELGLLYVDGHVRPYHGRTHELPKLDVQQRGRPMPGTKDFHVSR